MGDVVISVENLGKRYQLGQAPARRDGLRHLLQEKVTAPFRRFRAAPAEAGTGSVTPPQAPAGRVTPEEFWALRDVSFEVQRGEVLGIIGRNGAGKSTLLKILSRITEPTTGRITMEGRVASLLEVGTGFHAELTGRENIYLNGAILGMTRAEIARKFDEIVAFAEVERFLDTPVKRYSSGMYVRLAFAVAAHLEPEVLIVDEVLAVGDAEFQKKCLGKMQDVARQDGRTVLFVSHNMTAVQRLCGKSLNLSKGQVTFVGPTSEGVAHYLKLSQVVDQWDPNGSRDLSRMNSSGSGDVRFLGVRILDQEQQPCRQLSIGQPAHIEITFEALRGINSLVIGFAIHDALYEPLFASHWNDQGSAYSVSPGIWRTSCLLAPNYLRAGDYTVSLGAVAGPELCAHLPDALTLTIEKALNDPTSYYDERIGKLFIPMIWQPPHHPDQP